MARALARPALLGALVALCAIAGASAAAFPSPAHAKAMSSTTKALSKAGRAVTRSSFFKDVHAHIAALPRHVAPNAGADAAVPEFLRPNSGRSLLGVAPVCMWHSGSEECIPNGEPPQRHWSQTLDFRV
jgi:hypothetical protein